MQMAHGTKQGQQVQLLPTLCTLCTSQCQQAPLHTMHGGQMVPCIMHQLAPQQALTCCCQQSPRPPT
jgi:hypothetical protein